MKLVDAAQIGTDAEQKGDCGIFYRRDDKDEILSQHAFKLFIFFSFCTNEKFIKKNNFVWTLLHFCKTFQRIWLIQFYLHGFPVALKQRGHCVKEKFTSQMF